jgi:hypothetical protein
MTPDESDGPGPGEPDTPPEQLALDALRARIDALEQQLREMREHMELLDRQMILRRMEWKPPPRLRAKWPRLGETP